MEPTLQTCVNCDHWHVNDDEINWGMCNMHDYSNAPVALRVVPSERRVVVMETHDQFSCSEWKERNER